MKNRLFIAAVSALLLSIAPKAGAEIAAGIILGEPTGVSIRVDHFPVLGFAWSLRHNWMHVHGDYIFIDNVLQDPLRWYLGGGLFIGVGDSHVNFGVRVPIGLQIQFHPNFEVFGELAPGITLLEETEPNIGGGIGIRYIF
jgi:hypothetical protein